jgi:hypothetical protein
MTVAKNPAELQTTIKGGFGLTVTVKKFWKYDSE